jgi:CheY-like chemotaxis protein
MAVVWGTVQDHGGHIDVESSPGAGTTFTLCFPVTTPDPRTMGDPETVRDLLGKGQRILVVDDLKLQRDIATAMLRKLGYTPASAASGEEAVEYLETHTPDLVLLDMIMDPGMDGLETFRRMRGLRPTQKALIVSGFSETDSVREAICLGASGYLKKPYSLMKLGMAVLEALSRP